MSNFNRIIIMGNLTRDPEYKQLSSGVGVTRLGLASNRQYKNRQTGAMVQEVCFVDVDVFGPQAESSRQYLQKGRPVLIEGRLKFDSWQGADGQTRSKHSIVADRVVFLQAGGAQALVEPETTASDASEGLMVQDVAPAARLVSDKSTKNQDIDAPLKEMDEETEFAFKDEPPFQKLPF